jgi:hypothetical protein
MWCLAGGVELFDVMPVDRLHHANPGEFHRTATAASVTMWAAVCTCFILCWAFRDLLRHQAIASLSVRSFLPFGSTIGSPT